jgi:hypothetical protein
MSISEAIEALKRYVHHTAHAELLWQRHNWIREICEYLCRVVVGSGRHSPGIDEATAHLEKHGPTPVAFTFTKVFSTGR